LRGIYDLKIRNPDENARRRDCSVNVKTRMEDSCIDQIAHDCGDSGNTDRGQWTAIMDRR
jgi:hypothetical protein